MTHLDPIKDYRILEKRSKEYIKLENREVITWCSGCGNYGVQHALERALILEGRTNRDVALFYDIGCNGNGSDKINAYTFHGLHGRVISAAAGACLANPNIKVIAEGGDGGTFSEGINHLVHAVRSNYPMVFILHNNENYALTVGQASATTRRGQPMYGSPDGVYLEPINACHFILNLNPTFVARTFSGDTDHMTDMLRLALKHNGFAFIEVMQLCPTFNPATSQNWFLDRISYLDKLKSYNPRDINAALKASQDIEKKIMLGLLYHDPGSPNYLQRLKQREGITTPIVDEVREYSVSELAKQFE
jgi:2-oxoglutarate ferredoxin oxidoreductase subunit beta